MDTKLDVAQYAYHNGEFAAATRFLERSPATVRTISLRIKCLCELDQAEQGRLHAEAGLRAHPGNGELSYYLGMTLYLSGGESGAIEAAFRAALEAGHPAGHLGMGFLAYVQGATDRAMAECELARSDDFELEHVRWLMMFQVAVDSGRLVDAERFLEEADLVLRETPSLLRSYWGQLCWVRLLNASRSFELAQITLNRLKAQLSPQRTPRLYRNIVDMETRLLSRDGVTEVRAPSHTNIRRVPLPDEIIRKPTLSCLFHFLELQGDLGATKEAIVKHVWGHEYSPLTHDDRLYKAIGRLRKLLDGSGERLYTLFLRGPHYVLADASTSSDQPLASRHTV